MSSNSCTLPQIAIAGDLRPWFVVSAVALGWIAGNRSGVGAKSPFLVGHVVTLSVAHSLNYSDCYGVMPCK